MIAADRELPRGTRRIDNYRVIDSSIQCKTTPMVDANDQKRNVRFYWCRIYVPLIIFNLNVPFPSLALKGKPVNRNLKA